MTDIPVVNIIDDGKNYKFYCQFCKRWHRHGRSEGHRVAHCHNPDSPYSETGYVLKLGDNQ